MTTTTRTISIPMVPDLTRNAPLTPLLCTEHVIHVGNYRRYGIGAVPRGSEARKVTGGPMVPGPWAYVYGLSSVIDNHGGTGAERARKLAEGTEHDIAEGDLLEIDGVTYALRIDRWGDLRLDATE
jgi:hypothetical protein